MDFINKIIAGKYHVIIISPHHDDALLSCEFLLSQLSGKTAITIVNIFTKAHSGPYTLSAKKFLTVSGYTDANALYSQREKEDKKATSDFNVKLINFGFEDALFRRKGKKTALGNILAEFDHIYPTYRWHMLKGIAENDPAIAELEKLLATYKKKNTVVFAPYGVGSHIDHLLVRKVSEGLFDNLVLYSDFPYNVRANNYGETPSGFTRFSFTPDIQKKSQLIKIYKTQVKGLFGGVIPDHNEVYFINKQMFADK